MWRDITNVRTVFKAVHKSNIHEELLTLRLNDNKLEFLNAICCWLDTWGKKSDIGHLTKETPKSLKRTTHAIIEFASYCITEFKLSYILTGKFQIDSLEEQFRLYRQLTGISTSPCHKFLKQKKKKGKLEFVL